MADAREGIPQMGNYHNMHSVAKQTNFSEDDVHMNNMRMDLSP